MKSQQNNWKTNKIKQTTPTITSQSNNRDCMIILVVLLTFFIVFSAILSYSIFQSINIANSRLQKIQLKFHKFLFYIRYIYKSQKSQQQISKQQNNSIKTFLNKISQGFQQQKQQPSIQSTQKIHPSTPITTKPSHSAIIMQKKKHKANYKQRKNEVQLLSEQEMIDIAIKIIEQEDNSHEKNIQCQENTIKQKNQIKEQEKILDNNENQEKLHSGDKEIQTFNCNIDKENAFYKHFEFNPQKLILIKTKPNSKFQTIFCQQPIPNNGIYQFPIKILRTSKSFIYIGIATGNKSQIYNFTSLHESDKFYGYSGYSGRIWEATKRKNSYEMFQSNTIFKLRINRQTNLMEYFFNQIKVGETLLGNFCKNQCRFVIQMRDDGDQIQFLQTLKVDHFNATNHTIIDQL